MPMPMQSLGAHAALAPSDKVHRSTQALAIGVIPFLVAASAILWFWPDETGRLFAWPIKPAMTSFLLASAYVGGIYFFGRVLSVPQWHRVKVGFLPVATFASVLGIATALHWDRFTHDHVSFWAWAGLYFGAPPLVLAAWWNNRRDDPRQREACDPALPGPLRWALGAAGAAMLGFALWLFINPGTLIPLWIWKLTPLTARVISAIVAMQGVALIGMARDERWSVAAVMVEAELMTTPLIGLAALRARADFNAAGASVEAFVAQLAVAWLAMLGLFLAMQHRGRSLRVGTA